MSFAHSTVFRRLRVTLAWAARCATIGAALVSSVAYAPAAEAPAIAPDQFQFTADRSVTDEKTGETIAGPNARLVSGGYTLTADEIRYNHRTGEARASGHVLLTYPGFRLLGDSATYWFKENRFEATGFRLGQPPYYVAGEHAYGSTVKGAEEVTGENVQIFYGEPGPLAPRASAREIRVFRDQRFEADGLRILVGGFPLLAFGGLSRPLESPDITWETRAGFDDTVGLHAGVGLYLPVASALRAGGSIDLFSKRGVLFGPGLRYGTRQGDNATDGAMDFAYINDQGDPGFDALDRPIDDNRGFGSWRHQQRAGDRWTINGQLNWWEDSEVVRDFRRREFDESHEPDTFLEASWYGSHAIVSAFTRYRPHDFQIMPERLPEVRLDVLPLALGRSGILFEAQASAAALREKQIDGVTPNLLSDRLDTYAGLSRTFAGDGFAFTPVAGGRVTHYLEATGGRDNYTRWLGEIGFDSHLRAHRTWELDKPLWGIDGVRHIAEPYVSYRYVPDADRGLAFIPPLDRPAFLTQLQPLGLGERRDIDALGEIDVLRLGVRNWIETRHAEYGSRRLARLELAADLRFSEEHDGDELSDIQAEFELTPADWLAWWVFMRVDPDDVTATEFNSRFTLADRGAWSAGLGIDYLRGSLSQMQVFGRYRLNEASELFGAIRYDGREHRFNDIEFGFARRVHQNWVIECNIHARDGAQRESDFGVNLDLRFLAF